MKKLINHFIGSLLLFAILQTGYSQRQIPHEHVPGEFCKTMEVLDLQKQRNAALQDNMDRIERFTQQTLQKSKSRSSHQGVITIPVVFHVIYNQEGTNISEEQILSQLNVLNEDFRNRNENRGNTPEEFQDLEADVEIEFCLANVDPNGYRTSGITRTQTFHDNFFFFYNGFDFMKYDALGGRDAWPSDQYLNVWVCKLFGSGVLGYAQFPGDDPASDGIVLDYRFFGTVGERTPFPGFNGRTTTHEVGHWLNLRHIWGDGDCSVDDMVADTPLQGRPNGGYAYPCTFPGPNSCDEGEGDLPDMFQNYMDYSNDECMSLFTKGQKARMRALFEPGGPRESLLYSKGCSGGLDLALARRPLCTDGIRNGTEEGIDCGGDCEPCPADPYCLSLGDIPFDEWIESIAISGDDIITFENVSGNDFGLGQYQDLTARLQPGNSYQLDLTPGYFEIPFDEHWKVYIDYNKDQDFNNEEELVFDSEIATIGPVQGRFTVPETATGTTRMRIIMKYVDTFSPLFHNLPPEACGVYGFGETEDYTVSFYECNAPENVSGRVYGNDIVVSWESVLSATNYKVRYYDDGRWIVKFVTGTSFTLVNPGPGTYSFQVSANCDGFWSSKGKMITIGLGGSSSVGHLIATNPTTNIAASGLSIQRLYPNPTNAELSVSFAASGAEDIQISVTDLLGKTLIQQQQSLNGGYQIARLGVGHLPAGVYYVSLNNGQTLVTEKFVKN